jgi:hypothetical protein
VEEEMMCANKSSQDDTKIIELDFHLNRPLAVFCIAILLVAISAIYLARQYDPAAASPSYTPAYDEARKFYLTDSDTIKGANALSACAAGYHMASLWEILDTSQLEYDSDQGYLRADCGSGPPSSVRGWVRTGYYSSASNTAGQANCNVWITSTIGNYGSTAQLPWDWTSGAQDIHVWEVGTLSCSNATHVWCVED